MLRSRRNVVGDVIPAELRKCQKFVSVSFRTTLLTIVNNVNVHLVYVYRLTGCVVNLKDFT